MLIVEVWFGYSSSVNNPIDMSSPIYKVLGLMVCQSNCYLGDGQFDTGSWRVVYVSTTIIQSCHPKIKRDRPISIIVVSRFSFFNHRVSKKREI